MSLYEHIWIRIRLVVLCCSIGFIQKHHLLYNLGQNLPEFFTDVGDPVSVQDIGFDGPMPELALGGKLPPVEGWLCFLFWCWCSIFYGHDLYILVDIYIYTYMCIYRYTWYTEMIYIYIYIWCIILPFLYAKHIKDWPPKDSLTRQPLRRELGRAAERRSLLLQQVQAGGGTMGGQFAPLEWWFYMVFHWIGLRENLQETMVFTIKYRAFL